MATILIAGCNNESGLVESSDPPQVNLTSPAANEENVALNATISATFSKQMDPSSINDTTFTVVRDTTAIAGTISYGDSTATFTPTTNLTANSTIRARIISNVRDMDGNTMNQDFEWSFTTSEESDTDPPQVMETNPVNNTQDVSLNSAVTATFSEEMNPSTLNTETFLLEMGTSIIEGSVSYSGITAVFSPSENLEPGSIYSATITNGVQDTASNALPENYVWSFRTTEEEENTDNVAPQVSSTDPDDNQENVPVGASVQATFSEPMDASTISTSTFMLSGGGSSVSGSVSYSGTTATFNPNNNLEHDTRYTATISTGVTDSAGNSLAEDYEWDFTIEEEPDNEAPKVSSTDPDDNQENVPVGVSVQATFSEPMDASTISTSTFRLSGDGSSVSGSVSYSGNTATFNPNGDLEHDTRYTATITTGAEDEAGNPISEDYEWEFTTEEEPDNEAPSVSSTDPDDGEKNIAIGSSVQATFSEPMDASTISTSTFRLSGDGSSVSGSVSYSGNTATFNPNGDLKHNTRYTATITTGAEDEAGNPMSEDYEWRFTTDKAEDNKPPEVTETFPEDNDKNVETDITITASFSEALDPATVNEETFVVKRLLLGLFVQIDGEVSYSGTTASFTPDNTLLNDREYYVTITTGVTDLAGNALKDDYEWKFETESDNDDDDDDDDDDD